MGQGQSKDELLYQQVSYGNTEGIKSLHRDGAGLEWRDKDAKTPLIVACMNPHLYNVAKTLIELGANVNAYRPGRHGGTPLHHAAKRGFESIIKLLLMHGANPLILNDDCLTALEVARAKGHGGAVRTIESHLCLFSGWLRELHGPEFLEVVAPQLLSRKVWVVVLPVGSRTLTKPYKLELAIYSNLQDAQPRTVIALWKANLHPKIHQSDPSVTIVDQTTKTRVRLGPASENDKQQLAFFSNACKGIPQASPAFLQNNAPTGPPTAPPAVEDTELAMAINASLQSAMQERPSFPDTQPNSDASSSSTAVNTGNHGFLGTPNSNTSESEPVQETKTGGNGDHHQSHVNASELEFNPSAPPIVGDIPTDGPIQYPSIDLSPVDMASSDVDKLPNGEGKTASGSGSSCVICLDAPAEGACIPCGHVAGCMSCLNEVKSKKWGCPVCRAKIDQIIKLYHV
ncbi:putative E3 ubiquitin-protein ligase XBAT34 [Vigna radiata var. radiata]|uniref:E3 ubiquitin-protein ligase XBAT34 n=1 Tax=Vigna radiata var. radiata TaxID=3916 RepID=A0A1S3V5D0_VIGRR|nr:putative E3 ubiquitin-protein ligase XBAT34 [Vigna radiata var. radiata]